MTPAITCGRFARHLRRFGGERDGVSAVEFAIILPFMLTLYIGSTEFGNGMTIQFKSTLAARTVADLASQYVNIDSATMNKILGAASSVLQPYPSNNAVVTVSEVTTNAVGQGTVTWSASLNGTARPSGQSVTLPNAMQTANMKVIWGEVTYPYTPTMGYVITGTLNIYENVFFYPRLATCVSYNNAC
jgi:Flp pilus assembly protein TadG